jgi:hypothetical protein
VGCKRGLWRGGGQGGIGRDSGWGERGSRYRRAIRNSTGKMLDGGATYCQASRAPEFLTQDEETFRTFMKEADQDLAWQCNTVSDAFQRYLEIGETPAPHYPMRVAVLLSKAKDFNREREFLAVRAFPIRERCNICRALRNGEEGWRNPFLKAR